MNTAPRSQPTHHHTHFPAPTPPPLTELPPPTRPVGRPSTCTRDKVQMICTFIRTTGFSDSMAGSMAGIPRSTLSRWKEDEEIEMQLLQARGQYLIPRLEKIGQSTRPDGQPDWRALAWQVKWATQQGSDVRACDSRLRKIDHVAEAEQQAEADLAYTFERIAAYQARQDAAHTRAANLPICPEIPTPKQPSAHPEFVHECRESTRMGDYKVEVGRENASKITSADPHAPRKITSCPEIPTSRSNSAAPQPNSTLSETPVPFPAHHPSPRPEIPPASNPTWRSAARGAKLPGHA